MIVNSESKKKMLVSLKKDNLAMNCMFIVSAWLFLLIVFVSCTKDVKIIPAEKAINHVPGEFFADVTAISPTTAGILWSAAVDADSEVVLYRVYLDDTLYASGIQTRNYEFKNLAPSRQYIAKVVAYDRDQASSSCVVEIRTPDKLASDSRFLQILEFGQTNGSTSQVMGTMIRAHDGGFIMTGKSDQLVFGSPGGKLFVMKIDSLGNKLWTKTHKTRAVGMKIVRAPGGYLIVGDTHLLRLDMDGNLLWEKEVSTLNHHYIGATVDRLDQVYAVGSLFRDSSTNRLTAFLMKFDAQGNQVWEKKYSPTIWDYFSDVKLTADGNHLLVAGVTDGNKITIGEYNANLKYIDDDYIVYKLTLDGNLVWKHPISDPGGALGGGSVIETREGNAVLVGGSSGSVGSVRLVLNMIDVNGAKLWSYRNDELNIYGRCVEETPDDHLIVTGNTVLSSGHGFYLAKFSKAGTRNWYQHFYESGVTILPMSVIPLGDGGYFVNSRIEGVIGIFRTDPEGKFY